MAKGKKAPSSIIYGAQGTSSKPYKATRLKEVDAGKLTKSRSARMLDMIRRDMDLKGTLFQRRLRNEEILSLAYQDGTMLGGGSEAENLRENAVNYPYRYVRWVESQATSKEMVVEVDRNAGAGQKPGGPGDEETGVWVAQALKRIAYVAGFNRETKALIGEVLPRGTSVMRIGYHEQEITQAESVEVGKDGQSVIPEVLGDGDTEAKPGQAHAEISGSMATMASDPLVQTQVGREGLTAILDRKDSHDAMGAAEEAEEYATRQSTRLIRRRLWMRKLRVGEQCGWAPHVDDIEDAGEWWERFVWTVAEVKASGLFTDAFKAKVKGYDARNVSGVSSGAQTPSTQSMGSDARMAQSEDVLDDDERMVEWFAVWCRRPNMKSGGVRKIVCAECPDEFIEADEANPHVHPETGENLIPGFFPFFDFTPILSPITVPERPCGIPAIGVGMPMFEQMTELNRLLHESALRHALRFYDVHPAHKDNKKLLNALKNGEDGYAQVMSQAQMQDGKWAPSIIPIQFSGNTLDLERNMVRAESAWIKLMAMPPAVLQGMGTAGTAAQDNMGLAAGERESAALIGYFEQRMGDVFAGLRGLMRGCYDDEDFIALLGQEGAAVIKAWQDGSVDDGDQVKVTFGLHAQAELTVRIKQVMEAIAAARAEIDPITMQPKIDTMPLFEELYRLLDCGKPKLSAENMDALRKLAMLGKQVLEMQANAQGGGTQSSTGASGGPPSNNGSATSAGPNPSEGGGPQEGTLAAGAKRGTFAPSSGVAS